MKRIFIALLIAILSVPIMSGCSSNEKAQDAEQTVEVSKVDNVDKGTETVDKSQSGGIVGSQASLLITTLEMFGFTTLEPKVYNDSGDMYYPITENEYTSGIKQAYSLVYDTNDQIVEADLMIANINLIDESVFLESAKIYFSLLTITPYDSSDEEELNKWLEDNIKNLSEEDVSAVIGDAEFTLSCSKISDGRIGTVTMTMKKS